MSPYTFIATGCSPPEPLLRSRTPSLNGDHGRNRAECGEQIVFFTEFPKG
jgi:hypothetical protein